MDTRLRSVGLATALFPLLCGAVHAQGRTDVVTLANGDRITGEVVALERGQLEFKTDDAGTLYLEWDKLSSVTTGANIFEVTTTDGSRFVGSLGPSTPRTIALVAPDALTFPMAEVTQINKVGSNFWRNLDGAISAGFNYTRSSGVAQLNLNADTTYRRPGYEIRLLGSYTATGTEDQSDPDDRGTFETSYTRLMTARWVLSVIGRFDSNESLGLVLRSQTGAGVGPRLVNTNSAQLWLGAGVMVNRERGVDVAPTENLEGVFLLRTSYFTYDRPKTTIDISFQYLPSLSTPGRHRLQLDSDVRREFLKDLIVSLNLYDSFDSRPPNAAFDTNDVGIVFSIGWTF